MDEAYFRLCAGFSDAGIGKARRRDAWDAGFPTIVNEFLSAIKFTPF
jgi:hypothetical protein